MILYLVSPSAVRIMCSISPFLSLAFRLTAWIQPNINYCMCTMLMGIRSLFILFYKKWCFLTHEYFYSLVRAFSKTSCLCKTKHTLAMFSNITNIFPGFSLFKYISLPKLIPTVLSCFPLLNHCQSNITPITSPAHGHRVITLNYKRGKSNITPTIVKGK